jgi:hypothetical protein
MSSVVEFDVGSALPVVEDPARVLADVTIESMARGEADGPVPGKRGQKRTLDVQTAQPATKRKNVSAATYDTWSRLVIEEVNAKYEVVTTEHGVPSKHRGRAHAAKGEEIPCRLHEGDGSPPRRS